MSEDGLIRGIITQPETESENIPVVMLLYGPVRQMNDLIVGGTGETMCG
ncbi:MULTISPECIES: hypothetical protein [unclassified Mesotoga]|nr:MULTISPECIES: hypothetical protein [unclassified Mesotoga]